MSGIYDVNFVPLNVGLCVVNYQQETALTINVNFVIGNCLIT